MPVELHDGSTLVLRKADPEYDPTDRARAFSYLIEHQDRGEVVTGLLYFSAASGDMHARNKSTATPLADLDYDRLCPGADALAQLQKGMR